MQNAECTVQNDGGRPDSLRNAFCIFFKIVFRNEVLKMKANWIQTVSLLLCLILLAVTLRQNQELQQQQGRLESELRDLRMTMSEELRSISGNVEQAMEEANCSVADYTLEPQEISRERQALLAEVTVSLKEWYPDTQVMLAAEIGEQRSELPMESDGSGSFAAQLAIPLENSCEIALRVHISGGGMTRQEELGIWSDLVMLLPLQNTGSGWEGPYYQDGTMRSDFTIFLEGRDGKTVSVHDPHFLVYKNGELVQRIPAVCDPNYDASETAYTVDTQGNRWHLDCEIGDAIDIRFRCEDEYGLGYDFLFANWLAEGETAAGYNGAEYQSGSASVNFYWPE